PGRAVAPGPPMDRNDPPTQPQTTMAKSSRRTSSRTSSRAKPAAEAAPTPPPAAPPEPPAPPAPARPRRAFHRVDHTGSTVGRSGRRYSYAAGDLVEALDGDLDHVGGAEWMSPEEAAQAARGAGTYETRPLRPATRADGQPFSVEDHQVFNRDTDD